LPKFPNQKEPAAKKAIGKFKSKYAKKPGSTKPKKSEKPEKDPKEPPKPDKEYKEPGVQVHDAGSMPAIPVPPGMSSRLKVPKPGEKKTRGPDKKPRKPRADKGLKKDPEQEPEPEADPHAALVQKVVPPDAMAEAARLSRLKASKTTAGLILTADYAVCRTLLPPRLKEDEKEYLIEMWVDIIEENHDVWFSDPKVLATIGTIGVFAPRVGAAVKRLISALRSPRSEP